MRVLINNGKGYVDYTKYVVDGTLTVEDSVNVPTLTTFELAASDNSFVAPARSAYVRIVSDIYGQGGGYKSNANPNGKVLATGFVTNQPEPTYLGLNPDLPSQKHQQLQLNVQVTSDEWILNCQSIPYIPAFVNQTDTQILQTIAEAVSPIPGFFSFAGMASGTLIPYYQYDPTQTWSDIAKAFADESRYYYKVKDGKIIYQPFGQSITGPGLGISYDETTQKEPSLYPENFKTSIVSVPPVNDCIVIGDVEPQTNVDCYFVGDGFTSNFTLKHQVFQGTSSQLLSDDWTETAFAQGTWIVNDPQNTISLVDSNGNALGALNIVQKGTTQTYTPIQNATYVQAQNGLELGGGINLQHGQFIFDDTASGGGGVVGGIFTETTEFDPGHCLAGFQITGQPNLGSYSVFQVQAYSPLQIVMLSVSGINTALAPGNVFSCASFGIATWLNGQSLYVTSIQQNVGYFVITAVPQNPAIIPGVYGPTNDTGTITFPLNGIITTASGAAGIYVFPIYNGAVTGTPVISQPNHQYVLQTWIGAQTPNRFIRPYTNLTQTTTYGKQNLTASGTITWVITDYNIGNYVVEQQNPLFGLFPAAPPPVVTKFFTPSVNLPPFAIYVLLSGLDLNVSINYTVLSLPPQGYLTAQSLTGNSGTNLPWLPAQLTPAIPYQLGFGMINQTAQISQQGETFQLSFYTDDIPSVGARIRFQSWAAGQSVARVRDPGAIANEGKVSGDSGVRTAILTNLSPLPRTSNECEAAAAAAVLDREYPQWQGSYTIQVQPWQFTALFDPSVYDYPHTGLFLYVNSPVRGVSGQNFFVNTTRIQVTELRGETLTISLDYGPDLYLEKLLPVFLEREQNLLVPTQTVPPPNPITLSQVLNATFATLDNALVTSIVNSVTGNHVVVDLSGGTEFNPGASSGVLFNVGATGCEVRYVDSGWGNADAGRVGIFTVDQFTLPRTVRDQTFYLRAVNGPIVSRFSKALRIVYPLVPSAPALVSSNASTIVADYAGDVRDIYGLELRATTGPAITGNQVVIQLPQTNPIVNLIVLNRYGNGFYGAPGLVPFNPPLQAYFGNGPGGLPDQTGLASSLYQFQSPAPTGANVTTVFQLGDIVYQACPTDTSFNGFRIVTAVSLQNIGGQTQAEQYYGGIDFALPYPDFIGTHTQSLVVGTAQLAARTGFVNTASGSLSNGIATIGTRTPHGFVVGQIVVLSAYYCAAPVLNNGTLPWNGDNALFNGTWTITATPDPMTFQFQWNNPHASYIASCNPVQLNGMVAGFPANLVFTEFIPGAPAGTILQRGIFSPSDLVIDLSQPDIADTLSILEAVTPGSRVSGLELFFFNLTWDYSLGTPIPTFTAPVISGLVMNLTSQNLQWSLQQGMPDGHRVETFDLGSGANLSKYTVDHPSNPQLLKQATIPAADWINPRLFKVTPFDALGDGIPGFFIWGGSSGVNVIGGGGPTFGLTPPGWITTSDGTSMPWSSNLGRLTSGNANQVIVWMFRLTYAVTINKLNLRVNAGTGHAGDTAAFGVYDVNGNLQFQWFGIPVNASNTTYSSQTTGVFTNPGITLPPGIYWYAVGATTATLCETEGCVQSATSYTVWSSPTQARTGYAANPMAGGQLPASMGSPVTQNGIGQIAAVNMEA